MAWARIFDGVLPTAMLYVTPVFIDLFCMISPFDDLGGLGRGRLEKNNKKKCTTVMHFSLVERTES